jgi:hypothetical protein
MGGAAERIMRAAADFLPDAFAPTAGKHLENGKPLQIGPFAITPHLVDHSGFDAYALEIEACNRRLFYSGDLRAHGRKGKLFELMLKRPPKNIDVMLMEGSSLGRLADSECFPTEEALSAFSLNASIGTGRVAAIGSMHRAIAASPNGLPPSSKGSARYSSRKPKMSMSAPRH